MFKTTESAIEKFAIDELEEKSNVQKMHFSRSDKPIKVYNLLYEKAALATIVLKMDRILYTTNPAL
jgi:hypothetical protein